MFFFSNCGLFKWERDGMLKVTSPTRRRHRAVVEEQSGDHAALLFVLQEKRGPKIGGELLQPRGEEHGQFLNSMK